ncbi:MAG: hypothetical protein ACRDL0_02070 [Thermoleophilaceae bacterium]
MTDTTPGSRWCSPKARTWFPIRGTKDRHYLEENVPASEIALSDEDLRRLDEAAPPGATAGDRYPDLSTLEL